MTASYSLRHSDRQFTDPLPGRGEHRIRDRRGGAWHTRLSNAARLLIALHKVGLDHRTFIHAQRWKGVKIRLLQPPILECELLKKRRRRAEDCAAFHLCGDNAWVYVSAAIHHAHDPMHLDLSVLDRNFSHLRVIALEREVHGDSPGASLRQRLTPSTFLSGEVEHPKMSRMLQQ